MLSEQVRVETPDARRATDLLERLTRFDARLLVRHDGSYDVTVESTLRGTELNRLVDHVLDTVEAWLVANRLEATTVQVAGQHYLMKPSPAVQQSTQPI
jgi:hypothetical protein